MRYKTLHFIWEPFHTHTTLGTPCTSLGSSCMDAFEAAPNEGNFVIESGSTLEISRP